MTMRTPAAKAAEKRDDDVAAGKTKKIVYPPWWKGFEMFEKVGKVNNVKRAWGMVGWLSIIHKIEEPKDYACPLLPAPCPLPPALSRTLN